MSRVIKVKGSKLKIKSAIILARSPNYAISTVLNEGPSPRNEVIEALVAYLMGGSENIGGLGINDYMILTTLAYGGILLFWVSGERPLPLSRFVLMNYSPKIKNEECKPIVQDDVLLLRAWELIYRGNEGKGLDLLSKCSHYPRSLRWEIVNEPGLPVGYTSEPY